MCHMNDARPSSHQHNTLETTCQRSTQEHKCDISQRYASKGFFLPDVCGGLPDAWQSARGSWDVASILVSLASLNFSKAPLEFLSQVLLAIRRVTRHLQRDRMRTSDVNVTRERRRGRLVTDHDTVNLVLHSAREDSSTQDPPRSALPRSSRRRRLRSSCRWRPQLLDCLREGVLQQLRSSGLEKSRSSRLRITCLLTDFCRLSRRLQRF